MTKDEALQDLLFYLEQYRDGGALPPEIETALEKYEACRAALEKPDNEALVSAYQRGYLDGKSREALAEPAQEPVAYRPKIDLRLGRAPQPRAMVPLTDGELQDRIIKRMAAEQAAHGIKSA
jgi:hypothetical protein